MQEIADMAEFVDKLIMPCYKGIVKSKRLHKVSDTGARGIRLHCADTDTSNKILNDMKRRFHHGQG